MSSYTLCDWCKRKLTYKPLYVDWQDSDGPYIALSESVGASMLCRECAAALQSAIVKCREACLKPDPIVESAP